MIRRQRTGIEYEDGVGWWVVVVTGSGDNAVKYRYGRKGPDGQPVAYRTEAEAERKAVEAAALARRILAEAGVAVFDGPDKPAPKASKRTGVKARHRRGRR